MHVLLVRFLKDHSTSALEGLKSQPNVRLMYTEEKAAAAICNAILYEIKKE